MISSFFFYNFTILINNRINYIVLITIFRFFIFSKRFNQTSLKMIYRCIQMLIKIPSLYSIHFQEQYPLFMIEYMISRILHIIIVKYYANTAYRLSLSHIIFVGFNVLSICKTTSSWSIYLILKYLIMIIFYTIIYTLRIIIIGFTKIVFV